MYTILQHIRNISTFEATDKKMVVEYFLMTGDTLELYTMLGGERSAKVEISTIELHDLGQGGEQQAIEGVIKDNAEIIAEEALRGAIRSGDHR